jgi:ABC-type polysaccharide/polyol phosphate export permease
MYAAVFTIVTLVIGMAIFYKYQNKFVLNL